MENQCLTELEIFKRINNDILRGKIKEIIKEVSSIMNAINGCFPNYTMHDMGHCYRVAKYMQDLSLGNDYNQKKQFSDIEYTFMIMSALLHDIGMYFSEDHEQAIKKGKEDTENITYKGIYSTIKNKKEAVRELVRITHHKRVSKILDLTDYSIKSCLSFNRIDFSKIIIELCESHGEGYDYLSKLPEKDYIGEYSFNLKYIASLLRIADLIDIDKQRVPYLWYKINRPKGFSNIEWKKHFCIKGYNRLTFLRDNQIQICFYGECEDPVIYRNYLNYLTYIQCEIQNVEELLNCQAEDIYKINLHHKVVNNVIPKKFNYVDLKLNLDYIKITQLLMGEHIYQDKMVGLRELLQNAIDSCHLMKEKSAVLFELFREYQPDILISFSQKNNYVKIFDNGTGMNFDVIRKYFLNVGVSYYHSNDYKYENNKYKSIGKFGIGFLSSFLLSRNVTVSTCHYNESEKCHVLQLEKNSEYVILSEEKNQYDCRHYTEIKLSYNDFFNVFKGGIDDVIAYINKNFFTDVNIRIRDDDCDNRFSVCNKDINRGTIIDDSKEALSNSMFIKDIKQIDCQKYNDVINGNILINSRGNKLNVMDLDNSVAYCYDKIKKTLVPLQSKDIPNGQYRIFFYLGNVMNSLKDDINSEEELEKLVIKDLESQSYFKKVFVPIDVSFVEKKAIFYIDGLKLSSLFPKQYAEMQEINMERGTFNYGLKVGYKSGDKLLVFKGLTSSNYSINVQYENLFKENTISFSLYYKQIYVQEFDLQTHLPIHISIYDSHINCDMDEDIKLNVSRDKFLNGLEKYNLEIEKVLFSYLKDVYISQTSSPILIDYIDYKLKKLISSN